MKLTLVAFPVVSKTSMGRAIGCSLIVVGCGGTGLAVAPDGSADSHLARASDKLGVRSRTELALLNQL
jgi:hypothetical protein